MNDATPLSPFSFLRGCHFKTPLLLKSVLTRFGSKKILRTWNVPRVPASGTAPCGTWTFRGTCDYTRGQSQWARHTSSTGSWPACVGSLELPTRAGSLWPEMGKES